MTKVFWKKDFLVLFGLYFIANFLLLLNTDGIYWDDWAMYYQDEATFRWFMQQIQHGLKGDFAWCLLSIGNGIASFRFFTFFAIFLMGLSVYYILSTIKELTRRDVFYITLFFILAPINMAKVSNSVVPFLFPVLLFYLSFALFVYFLEKQWLWLRVALLVLFTLSFSTNSVLVFYFSIFVYAYYFHFGFEIKMCIRNALVLFKKYLDFLLLPFAFFIYKSLYLKPYGIYEGYNQINAKSALKGIGILFKSLYISLYDVVLQSAMYGLYAVPFFIIVFYVLRKKSFVEHFKTSYCIPFLIVGFFLFFLSVFPYAMVGKSGGLEGWSSRFQMLNGLGIALVLYFGILFLQEKFKWAPKTTLILIWFMIVSFSMKNMHDYYKAQVDWFYNLSVIENMKTNEIIKEHTTFVIHNNINDKLLFERRLRFYEYNGLFKRIFKDETRNAFSYKQYCEDMAFRENSNNRRLYLYSEWKNETPWMITMTENYQKEIRDKDFIKLMYYKFFNENKYRKGLQNMTSVFVTELGLIPCRKNQKD